MERVILSEKILCHSCMEEHEVQLIEAKMTNVFKGIKIEYPVRYYYCDCTGEAYCNEEMTVANDISMKDSYRKSKGLLTSDEIIAIRKKYGITQKDFCLLLGWGEKTITRYESHQVQDFAHDSILRKIDNDPAWFLSLLNTAIQNQSFANPEKYITTAEVNFAEKYPQYLIQALISWQLLTRLPSSSNE